MAEVLKVIAGYVALGLQAVAILVIVIGAIESLIGILRVILIGQASDTANRAVWLEFARWLIAGLTFQLAAGIVETTVAPTWDEIGRVAAIAAIRTLLTFFIDRDIDRMSDFQRKSLRECDDAGRA